jgi:hypothetical protein
MSKKKETVFMEKIDRELKEYFGKGIFLENIQQVTKKFSSDRYICLGGRFVAIEGKTDDGEATPGQILKLLEIRIAGGIALLTSPSTWENDFKKLKKVYASAKYKIL